MATTPGGKDNDGTSLPLLMPTPPLAIGIDLGTSHSRVAVWRNGKVDVLCCDVMKGNGRVATACDRFLQRLQPPCLDDASNTNAPYCTSMRTAVAFGVDECLIGDEAWCKASQNPTNTVTDVKRLLGRLSSDTCVQEDISRHRWPFHISKGRGNRPVVVVSHGGRVKQLAAEEVVALLFTRLKEVAEAHLGKEVKQAVVSIPSFNNAQRQALKDAGHIAGLEIIRAVKNPSAAALALAAAGTAQGQESKQQKVLLFSMGGGTTDVQIVVLSKGAVQVKAVVGDTNLGGDDFDRNLLKYLLESKTGGERSGTAGIRKDPSTLCKLRRACEAAKRTLSSREKANVKVRGEGGEVFAWSVTRAEFEDVNTDIFFKCEGLLQWCLYDAGLERDEIDSVVLLGGCSAMPKLRRLVHDFLQSGKPLSAGVVDPLNAVVIGTAVQAAMLTGDLRDSSRVPRFSLMEVAPYTISLLTDRGTKIVLPKQTTIPTTYRLNQKAVPRKLAFKVYEGEQHFAAEELLGEVEVTGEVQSNGSSDMMSIEYSLDHEGMLLVRSTPSIGGALRGKENARSVAVAKGLTGSDLAKMVKAAQTFRKEDDAHRKEKRLRGQRFMLLGLLSFLAGACITALVLRVGPLPTSPTANHSAGAVTGLNSSPQLWPLEPLSRPRRAPRPRLSSHGKE